MWPLRKASKFVKNQKFTSGFLRLFHMRSEMAINSFVKEEMIIRSSCSEFGKCLPLCKFGHSSSIILPNISIWKHAFSSQTVSKSSREDDELEDGFSKLKVPVEVPASNNSQMENLNNEDLDKYFHDGSVAENDFFYYQTIRSKLFRVVSYRSTRPFDNVLNKWIKDGNELNKEEILQIMFALRKRKKYERALKLSWWLEKSKKIDFKECDYAIRVDFMAMLHGIEKAERYIEKIPKSFQGEIIYQTLLRSSVTLYNMKKSEEIFNKMKDDLKFPLTTFACDQLLRLYMQMNDKKKIDEVFLLMESQNLKFSLQTYKTLMDAKCRSNDRRGMEQIFETMTSKGIKPDTETHIWLARYYVSYGLIRKAETFMKEIEKDTIQNKRGFSEDLFPLYAALSKPAEVKGLWSLCEKHPTKGEMLAAIYAWGALKNVEEAEAVFDGVLRRWKETTASHYRALLKVYADNKEFEKGKNLVKQMANNGIEMDSWCWDRLVKMLLEVGEVEKAVLVLERAVSQNKISPLPSTYEKIMGHYASRGDVHNCEKIFQKCKELGSKGEVLTSHFQILVQAYVTSKTPAYGMRERLKVDNVLVSKVLATQLEEIDAFWKAYNCDSMDTSLKQLFALA